MFGNGREQDGKNVESSLYNIKRDSISTSTPEALSSEQSPLNPEGQINTNQIREDFPGLATQLLDSGLSPEQIARPTNGEVPEYQGTYQSRVRYWLRAVAVGVDCRFIPDQNRLRVH
ncbi:MAG: hypothetical protein HQL18_04380 [Candidatus Omnitrophica bacterium]|nr:hypothetical protein [Candidatus Omnitrophota bacterium]